MVHYICRTCFHVNKNPFSFRNLKKVKAVLDCLVPEVKNLLDQNSMVCEQCYYFLKTTEKFKTKCIEVQKKIFSASVDCVTDNYNVIISSTIKQGTSYKGELNDSQSPNKNGKRSYSVICDESQAKKSKPIKRSVTSLKSTKKNNKVSENDLVDGVSIKKFASATGKKYETQKHKPQKNILKELSDEDYVSKKDLVEAGFLSDDEDNSGSEVENAEIIENVENLTLNDITHINVKKEPDEEQNPGFFNKKGDDGLYRCRLCRKVYKTSKGLYNHTKEKHSGEVRFFHCSYCSFFTLWRSALVRHCTVFHANDAFGDQSLHCYHCSFQTQSKDVLSNHISTRHLYGNFMTCDICNKKFSDHTSFAQHVNDMHLSEDNF